MAMPGDVRDADRTVFVGNLDPLVKEEILYELFLQAGPVVRVTLARDRDGRRRPFGFVQYKHAEAVPYAIALLNGICLYGRPLKLDFSTGSSQDAWGSFGSPDTGNRGPNTVRKGVCSQDSSFFNYSGFIPHGDCRSQDQIMARDMVCNWPPCQVSPLTPLPHHVAPHPFPGLFTSSPLQPWAVPGGAFWTSPLTPLLPPTPLLPERERETPPAPLKEREMAPLPQERETERERHRQKPPVLVKERQREREKLLAPLKEQEKEEKRHKHRRMRSRKHRHQGRHKT